MYFTLTAWTSLEDSPRSRIVVGQSSKTRPVLQLRGTRIACARTVNGRTYVLSRRYGGANCNLCLIAIVVGAPRQRESCAAGGRFYVLKGFEREPCHHHSRQKTPWLHHRASRWCKSRLRGSHIAFINLRGFAEVIDGINDAINVRHFLSAHRRRIENHINISMSIWKWNLFIYLLRDILLIYRGNVIENFKNRRVLRTKL